MCVRSRDLQEREYDTQRTRGLDTVSDEIIIPFLILL